MRGLCSPTLNSYCGGSTPLSYALEGWFTEERRLTLMYADKHGWEKGIEG
ncbi:MAG: hypothetical protein Q7N50_07735 [Armatimonadota bacterium]|nr:hypothetical protein [Armatimonadota bacterium]